MNKDQFDTDPLKSKLVFTATDEVIRRLDLMRQPVDFRGLGHRQLLPSDIDGAFDIYGRGLLMFELKHERNSEVPIGQRLLYERICRWVSYYVPAMLIVGGAQRR